MTTEASRFEEWAIAEIMGHAKYVGFVSEAAIGGSAMVRVDVPEVPATEPGYRAGSYDTGQAVPAFTRYFGAGSIYSITPISEELARLMVARHRAKPHNVYLPELYPPAEPKAIAAEQAIVAADDDDDIEFDEGRGHYD